MSEIIDLGSGTQMITVDDDVLISDESDGTVFLATKSMSIAEVMAGAAKQGIKTVLAYPPTTKFAMLLIKGYTIALLKDGGSHCTIYTLNKVSGVDGTK